MSNPHPLSHPTHTPVIIYKQDALFPLTFLLFLLLRHNSSSEWTWAAYAAKDDLERLVLDSVSQVLGLQMPSTTTVHFYGTRGPRGYQLSYIPALDKALTGWNYASTLKSSSWFLGFLSHMMRIMFAVPNTQGHKWDKFREANHWMWSPEWLQGDLGDCVSPLAKGKAIFKGEN